MKYLISFFCECNQIRTIQQLEVIIKSLKNPLDSSLPMNLNSKIAKRLNHLKLPNSISLKKSET